MLMFIKWQSSPYRYYVLNNGMFIVGGNVFYATDAKRIKHMVTEGFTYIPRDNEVDNIIEQFNKRQLKRKERNNSADKSVNPFASVPGNPGIGKSTFLCHLKNILDTTNRR